jgi:Ternary complex associated domain 9
MSNQTSNRPLKIFWQGSHPDLMTRNLELDGKPIEQDTSFHKLLTAELEDLLCDLFYKARAIVVEPMTAGHSGTGVLKIQPFYPGQGGGQKVVVKFGDVRQIEREYTNYTKYVQLFIGDGRNTAFLTSQRTRNLGGIVCSFVGTSIDQLQDFGTFYHQQSASEVASVLDQLFHHTCGPWYAGHRSLWPLDLTEDYQRLFRYPWKRIEQVISTCWESLQSKKEQLPKSVKHAGVYRLLNPLPIVTGAQPFVRPTYVCTTHGDLNPHNLFIDSSRQSWLIDFQSTGPGHILRDLAMLDSVVRFQLLLPGEATLSERFAMEEALCGIKAFSQVEQLKTRFSTENAALAKTYGTVVHLRTLAQGMMGKSLSDDMSEYYIALFYNALNTLRFSSLDVEQHEHALLSICLLADHLKLGENVM